MLRVQGQPAWVLHQRPWREHSALVELFTREHGRIGVVARGVQGARRQTLRAALQPLSLLHVDYVQRGELGQLQRAEALAPPLGLVGEALLAGLYLNELLVRLLPRQEAQTALFDRYGQTLSVLTAGATLAWPLRCFERDLLYALGVAPDFGHDSAARPPDPAARYRVEAEAGIEHDPLARPGSISGEALLALAADRAPPAAALRELREMLRRLIGAQLGARPLRSWGLLAEFSRLSRGE